MAKTSLTTTLPNCSLPDLPVGGIDSAVSVIHGLLMSYRSFVSLIVCLSVCLSVSQSFC
jgi:hypothetical protein